MSGTKDSGENGKAVSNNGNSSHGSSPSDNGDTVTFAVPSGSNAVQAQEGGESG